MRTHPFPCLAAPAASFALASRRPAAVAAADAAAPVKGDLLNASYYPSRADAANVTKRWYIIDAKGQTLGRLATLAATFIRWAGLRHTHRHAWCAQAHIHRTCLVCTGTHRAGIWAQAHTHAEKGPGAQSRGPAHSDTVRGSGNQQALAGRQGGRWRQHGYTQCITALHCAAVALLASSSSLDPTHSRAVPHSLIFPALQWLGRMRLCRATGHEPTHPPPPSPPHLNPAQH